MREQLLTPGKPTHIVISVVYTAMLHTTPKFNALQILAESDKFDLTEPVILHWSLPKSI